MAQLDVYRLNGRSVRLVVSVQSDLLDSLSTCVVVPLDPFEPDERQAMSRLTPVIGFDGDQFLAMTPSMGALRASVLGKPVGSIAEDRDAIIAAIDFLISGF